jgi:radical SAM superfamily enzyme YgiQ (UPF0313 family)
LLINSPDDLFSAQYTADPKIPLGLLYLAGALQRAGYTTSIIDCHAIAHTKGDVLRAVRAAAPKLIGINVTTPNRRVVFDLTDSIKECFPAVPIVIGGPHGTSLPADVLANCAADAVVIGEGECVIVDLMRQLPSIECMDGVFTREDLAHGRPRRLAPRIKDLDDLPFPDFSLLPLDKYLAVSRELYLSSSRGCIYDCAFCSIRTLLGRGLIGRSSENVIKEMRQLLDVHGVERYYFYDDDFMLWPALDQFCEQVAPLGVRWCAQGTLNDVRDAARVQRMADGGCYRMSFGFESGSYRMQKYIAKIIKERSLQLLPAFTRAGIQTRGYFVVGMPQEEMSDYIDTLQYLLRLRDLGLSDVSIFAARPYPGTRLFDECVRRYGAEIIPQLLDFYFMDDWRIHEDEVLRDKMRRYNTLPAFQVNPHLTPMQVREFVALANEVFFHPEEYHGRTREELFELTRSRLDRAGGSCEVGTSGIG